MSYNIISGIQEMDGADGKEMWFKSACNNVYPRTPRWERSETLSKILREQGKQAVDIEILRTYADGSFQGGRNKYTRALKILRHMEEYKKFDYRNFGLTSESDENQRKYPEEYKQCFIKALTSKLPKDKFIVKKDYFGKEVYAKKITKRSLFWTAEKLEAKIFKYRVDAENIKRCFTGSESFQVEQIA